MVTKPERRHYIDWLRALAVLTLFAFHTTRIFDIWENFYVKNDHVSFVLSHIFIAPINPWFMPLFFFLAGASTSLAMRFRSGGQYAKERFKRLFIPSIFGLLLFIPPQSYFGLRNHSTYAESFLKYYPHFFKIIPEDIEGYYLGGFTLAHLWFIFYLFMFSLVALPLFLYLRRNTLLIDWLAAFFARSRMIFLLAVPLIITKWVLDFNPNPLYFITFFIYGYIMLTDERLEKAIERNKSVALIAGLLIYGSIQMLKYGLDIPIPNWLVMILKFIYGFAPWLFLIALLGYGKQHLNFTNQYLSYVIAASYPFYILHQTVIVIIGFYVVQWNTSILVKFVTILVCAFTITALLYDLLVKRINMTRFLFGMKSRE